MMTGGQVVYPREPVATIIVGTPQCIPLGNEQMESLRDL